MKGILLGEPRLPSCRSFLMSPVIANSGVLSRKGTMNFHVRDIQSFIGVADGVPFSRYHPLSMVNQRSTSAGEDRMEQRFYA